jgi:hypothetical protein
MHDAALALGYGERLALIPQMADPKNLFGTLLCSDVAADRVLAECFAA